MGKLHDMAAFITGSAASAKSPRCGDGLRGAGKTGQLAVFLASPFADYVTCATYVVEGGLTHLAWQGAQRCS